VRNAETVFSSKFSSAGKGPFMAGKAKNAPKAHVPGGRRGRGPYYRGVLTGKLDHVNVTFLGPYEPFIIRWCPYYKNGLLRGRFELVKFSVCEPSVRQVKLGALR